MLRKSIFIISLIIVFLTVGFFIYNKFFKKEEKINNVGEQIKENLLKSTTAPNQGREVSKELLDSATAPNQGREVSKELLDSATAPE